MSLLYWKILQSMKQKREQVCPQFLLSVLFTFYINNTMMHNERISTSVSSRFFMCEIQWKILYLKEFVFILPLICFSVYIDKCIYIYFLQKLKKKIHVKVTCVENFYSVIQFMVAIVKEWFMFYDFFFYSSTFLSVSLIWKFNSESIQEKNIFITVYVSTHFGILKQRFL